MEFQWLDEIHAVADKTLKLCSSHLSIYNSSKRTAGSHFILLRKLDDIVCIDAFKIKVRQTKWYYPVLFNSFFIPMGQAFFYHLRLSGSRHHILDWA